jgi:hypothetical protein
MATHPSTVAAQSRTIETATRTGTHWTQTELDKARADAPLEEIARQLGRTLYAVTAARTVRTERAVKAAPATSTQGRLPYDRGFHTLEEMGF